MPDALTHEVPLPQSRHVLAGDAPFPHLTVHSPQQVLRRGVDEEPSLANQRDMRGSGFHVRHDVRGQDDDPLPGEIR